jgi:cell division protein ZapA (FtsZ GTPase activity inhibitor)
MASTHDLQPEPAATSTSGAKARSWARLGDHPIQTALTTAIATFAAGMLMYTLNDHSNKIDTVETTLTARIDKVDAELTARIDALDAKVDEINLNLTAQINALDQKLTAQINALDLKLTALIAGLGMTDLVDAAVEGRLPAAEPAEAEPPG